MNNHVFDKNGYPIKIGDLLKVFSFVGSRRKKYFMYKLVTEKNGKLYAVAAHEVVNKGVQGSTGYFLSLQDGVHLEQVEIVEGYFDGVHYEDRPKQARA